MDGVIMASCEYLAMYFLIFAAFWMGEQIVSVLHWYTLFSTKLQSSCSLSVMTFLILFKSSKEGNARNFNWMSSCLCSTSVWVQHLSPIKI